MAITQEQALELAEKYILQALRRIALKEDISVSRSPEGWAIVAKTTPMAAVMPTERIEFTINAETGILIEGHCTFKILKEPELTPKTITEGKSRYMTSAYFGLRPRVWLIVGLVFGAILGFIAGFYLHP